MLGHRSLASVNGFWILTAENEATRQSVRFCGVLSIRILFRFINSTEIQGSVLLHCKSIHYVGGLQFRCVLRMVRVEYNSLQYHRTRLTDFCVFTIHAPHIFAKLMKFNNIRIDKTPQNRTLWGVASFSAVKIQKPFTEARDRWPNIKVSEKIHTK